MTHIVDAFADLLPARIERVAFQDPTLTVAGDGWSLSATCAWRWVDDDGSVVSPAVSGLDDQLWELVGTEIKDADWEGPASLGLDPTFGLGSRGTLQLFSDAAFDTWVLQTPSVVLVGPLRLD